MQVTKVIEHITKWLKDYKSENPNIKGFVVGVSGGIDSALVSTLCARTGLPLLVLQLSIHQVKDEVKRSTDHMLWLKQQFGDTVKSHSIDLTDAFEGLKKTLLATDSNGNTKLALANVRSRLRMVSVPLLHAKNHTRKILVISKKIRGELLFPMGIQQIRKNKSLLFVI